MTGKPPRIVQKILWRCSCDFFGFGVLFWLLKTKGAGRGSGPQSVFPQNLQILSVPFPSDSLEKIWLPKTPLKRGLSGTNSGGPFAAGRFCLLPRLLWHSSYAHRGPQKLQRFPRQEKAMLHCDLRVRWKVASDLRFQAAISEPKSPSFCGISGDLTPSTIAIVRFWCAKLRIFEAYFFRSCPYHRRPPDYSSNLCPTETFAIWLFGGCFGPPSCFLLYKRPKTTP